MPKKNFLLFVVMGFIFSSLLLSSCIRTNVTHQLNSGDDDSVICVQNDKGMKLFKDGRYKEAIAQFEIGAAVAKTISPYNYGVFKGNIATAYINLNDFKNAYENAHESVRVMKHELERHNLTQEAHDQAQMILAFSLFAMGSCDYSFEKDEKSEEELKQAFNFAKRTDFFDLKIKILTKWGLVRYARNDIASAVKMVNDAIDICKKRSFRVCRG